MRQVATEYQQTPEGIATATLAPLGIKAEDFQIDIPSIDHYDLPPGYDAAEDW